MALKGECSSHRFYLNNLNFCLFDEKLKIKETQQLFHDSCENCGLSKICTAGTRDTDMEKKFVDMAEGKRGWDELSGSETYTLP